MGEIEDLSCFIDSDGNLIKIDSSTSIEEFSKKYCEELNIDFKKIYSKIQIIKPEYRDLELSYRDLLIDILGYVLYIYNSKEVDIIAPEYNINERDVTEKQFDVVLDLIKFSKQSQYYICKLFFINGKYEHITLDDIIEENKRLVLTNHN